MMILAFIGTFVVGLIVGGILCFCILSMAIR